MFLSVQSNLSKLINHNLNRVKYISLVVEVKVKVYYTVCKQSMVIQNNSVMKIAVIKGDRPQFNRKRGLLSAGFSDYIQNLFNNSAAGLTGI